MLPLKALSAPVAVAEVVVEAIDAAPSPDSTQLNMRRLCLLNSSHRHLQWILSPHSACKHRILPLVSHQCPHFRHNPPPVPKLGAAATHAQIIETSAILDIPASTGILSRVAHHNSFKTPNSRMSSHTMIIIVQPPREASFISPCQARSHSLDLSQTTMKRRGPSESKSWLSPTTSTKHSSLPGRSTN